MAILRKPTVATISSAAPFVVRSERASEVVAREVLLDAALATTVICAPASACATDKRPPKALRFRP
jgi:hypothetical protein